MRLTINLDEDLYAVTKSLAREQGTSVSRAVNQLLRRALDPPAATRQRRGASSLPVIACTRTFTSTDVEAIELESS